MRVRRRIKPLVLLAVPCFAFGLALGWMISDPPDRVDTAMRLLEERCLPALVSERDVETHDLLPVHFPPPQSAYVDGDTLLTLVIETSRHDIRCGVEDRFAHYTTDETREVVERAVDVALTVVPDPIVEDVDGLQTNIFRVVVHETDRRTHLSMTVIQRDISDTPTGRRTQIMLRVPKGGANA